MQLKTLPEDVIKKLLEGEENVLTPRIEGSFKRPPGCPACGGIMVQDREDGRDRLICPGCNCAMDVETGLVVRLGNPEKTRELGVRFITTPSSGNPE